MQVKHRLCIAAVVSAVLLSSGERVAAQSTKKTPTKKPAPPTTIVNPTASEGTTAIAARGRPVSTAAGRAVNNALQKALANATVRNAVRAEVLRQLRVRRPFAIVNGYLASAIDLASVYQAPGVRSALLTALGVNGPQLINQAGVSADRLMIAFVPAAFGQVVVPQFTADITAAVGVNALKAHIPDIGPVVMIFILAGSGLGLTIAFAESLAAFVDWLFTETPPENPKGTTGDWDGDNLLNYEDPDDDNDGVNDDVDNYPWDSSRSICDCGRPRAAISLTPGAAGDFLPTLVRALTATQAQRARALSLGVLLQGQPNTLAAIF
jgi:hypothetical protein